MGVQFLVLLEVVISRFCTLEIELSLFLHHSQNLRLSAVDDQLQVVHARQKGGNVLNCFLVIYPAFGAGGQDAAQGIGEGDGSYGIERPDFHVVAGRVRVCPEFNGFIF